MKIRCFTVLFLIALNAFARPSSSVEKLFPLNSFGSREYKITCGPLGCNTPLYKKCAKAGNRNASVIKISDTQYLFKDVCDFDSEFQIAENGSYLVERGTRVQPYIDNPVDEGHTWVYGIDRFTWKYLGEYKSFSQCWEISASAVEISARAKVFCEGLGLVHDLYVDAWGRGWSADLIVP